MCVLGAFICDDGEKKGPMMMMFLVVFRSSSVKRDGLVEKKIQQILIFIQGS